MDFIALMVDGTPLWKERAKMRKILLLSILFLIPVMELHLSASSSSAEGEGGGLFYYDTILCSECAGAAYLYDTDISDWRPVNYLECKGTPRYNDTVLERDIDKLYICLKCRIETRKEITENKVICDHP